MNIRKPSDYSSLYSALDVLMGSDLAEMELYCEIGRAVCGRTEKGAAVMAAEYLQSRYPERKGFSPRNLRRMRLFYLTYGNTLNEPRFSNIFIEKRGSPLSKALTYQGFCFYIDS